MILFHLNKKNHWKIHKHIAEEASVVQEAEDRTLGTGRCLGDARGRQHQRNSKFWDL
jgi:hypothetical protein